MTDGLDRVGQQDFARGMFQSVERERIPGNGAYDIVNGLLDETGAVYKRGGTEIIAGLTTRPTGLWQGTLTSGAAIVGMTPTTLFLIDLVTGFPAGIFLYSGMTVPRRVAAYAGVLYLPGGVTFDGTTLGTVAATVAGATLFAVVANRLIAANIGGTRVRFSNIGAPATFTATDFHEIPDGASITGLVGLRDSAFVFTTQGVWAISNLALNLTDTAGNVQQRLDQYSTDLILWADAGIAGWGGALVVPARDGVWLMSRGVASEAPVPFQMISEPINTLYRGYVAAGHRPGQAIVYKGHYILPILSSGALTWVDTLVCRLDARNSRGQQTFPWSRLSGLGAQAPVLAAWTPLGKLLGSIQSPNRLCTLSYFEPSASSCQDLTVGGVGGADYTFDLITRDIATGPGNANTVSDARLEYELTDPGSSDPTITASIDEAGAWTALTGSAAEVPAKPFRWPVAKRRRYVRLRFTNTNAAARLAVKGIDVRVRSSGRV